MPDDPQQGVFYQIGGIRLPLGEGLDTLRAQVAERLGCPPTDILDLTVLKRSLDARGRRHPRYDLSVRVELAGPLQSLPNGVAPWSPMTFQPLPVPRPELLEETIVIVGTGPCGLFAALTLVERGIRPIVLDRGQAVEARAKSVSRLMGRSELNPESNLCFGEGGAGTWSDGKLYTRIGGQDVARVLQRMVDLGAPDDILIDRRPHLGTDRLVRLLKGIRRHLEAEGTVFRFDTRVDRIEPCGRRGVLRLADGSSLEVDRVILATGHSSRDLYRSLRAGGVAMAAKPFAVGLRVEHPQQLINEIQFGRFAQRTSVPAADYRLTFNRGTTQVYTFCMCPGGSVVPTMTRAGEVCVNGMSHSARSGHFANSALVTPLLPEELPTGDDAIMAGIQFQEEAEGMAYALGEGDFCAPAARLADYQQGRGSSQVRRTTYRCGVRASDLRPCYPETIHKRIRAGIEHFETKMHGFLSDEAVLIGVETRTSSPVRIIRDDDYRSVSHPFLYPGGEGSGYAGGITSSAVDGLRIARRILAGP